MRENLIIKRISLMIKDNMNIIIKNKNYRSPYLKNTQLTSLDRLSLII